MTDNDRRRFSNMADDYDAMVCYLLPKYDDLQDEMAKRNRLCQCGFVYEVPFMEHDWWAKGSLSGKDYVMTSTETGAELLLEDEALRDGLQMESRIFSLEEKQHIFQLLKIAGLKRIQVGSFVHPKVVPQMADTDELIRILGNQEDSVISALILNEKGLERALNCEVSHVDMSVSVSDTHSRKNAGRPAAEALAAMTQLIRQALAAGLDVRAGLQCVFGCVYEG